MDVKLKLSVDNYLKNKFIYKCNKFRFLNFNVGLLNQIIKFCSVITNMLLRVSIFLNFF
jgi:hypothetical protein